MKIRKANFRDAQRLSRLALSLSKYYGDDDPTGIAPFFKKRLTIKEFEKYLKEDKTYEHYIYEKNNQIIAYFSLLNETHFLYLFVDEQYHRQGIGKTLVEYALKEKSHEIYTVNSSLYAIPFYQNLGFISNASVQNYKSMIWLKN